MIATIAFVLIIGAAVACAIVLFSGKPDRLSGPLLAAAALALVVQIVQRSLVIGFPALTGMFESLVFYSAAVCLITVLYGLQKRLPVFPALRFGMIMVAIVLLALASSPLAPKAIQAPVPALRSGWLVMHVAFSFIGEAFFALSFIASIVFLSTKGREEKSLSRRSQYDRLAYLSVVVGYPVFTVGALIFGAVWAQAAWGTWWSWDPKETWALVTWLLYTVYLHLRLYKKREGALVAWINVVGFLSTLFTFFGVNFLLSGLHSYR